MPAKKPPQKSPSKKAPPKATATKPGKQPAAKPAEKAAPTGKASNTLVEILTWCAAINSQAAAELELPKGMKPADAWDLPGAVDARLLVYRVEEPAALDVALQENHKVMHDDHRSFNSLKLPRPAGFKGWAEKASKLWAQLGVSVNPEKLAEGARISISPYHCRVATDPKHPLYNAEKARRLVQDMTALRAQIDAYGSVLKPIHLAPWPEEEGLALYVVDGGRRREAALRNNAQDIAAFCDALRGEPSLRDSLTIAPPVIIRYLGAEVIVDSKRAQTARSIANHGNLGESIIAEAREAGRLHHSLGYDKDTVADLMGKSYGTIENLLRLAKLAPKLRESLEAGSLAPTLAYALASHPHKKQLECWKAIADISKPADKLRAATYWLVHEKLPPADVASRKPIAGAKIAEAAERLKDKLDDPELGPIAHLFAYLAGDTAALERLPGPVRAAFEKPKPRPLWDGFTEAEAVAWKAADVWADEAARQLRQAGLGPAAMAKRVRVMAGGSADLDDKRLGGLFVEEEIDIKTAEELAAAEEDEVLAGECSKCGRVFSVKDWDCGGEFPTHKVVVVHGDISPNKGGTCKGSHNPPNGYKRPAKGNATTNASVWGVPGNEHPDEAWEAADIYDQRLATTLAGAGLSPDDMMKVSEGHSLGHLYSSGQIDVAEAKRRARQQPLFDESPSTDAPAGALRASCICNAGPGEACNEGPEFGPWAMDDHGQRVHAARRRAASLIDDAPMQEAS